MEEKIPTANLEILVYNGFIVVVAVVAINVH